MRCFVISPIGQPGSAAREHADDVFECIIKPALVGSSVTGHRADHIKDVGRITKQMYNDILTADFCIAVLHGFNPNVFYELAVAHSAGIPVILLSEKGTDPPFDLKDERTLHYDLSPRPIYRGDNVQALSSMIDGVRRMGGTRQVPFGENLRPLNASSANLPYSLENETNAPSTFWLDLVLGSKMRLYLAGIGFTGWRGIPGMKDALRKVAAAGCDVRVLTMDTENPRFKAMMNPEVAAHTGAAHGIAEARRWFSTALGGVENAEVRALSVGSLFQQIIVSDDRALISPYLYSSSTPFSPCVKIARDGPGFAAFCQEFDQLWQANEPAREQNQDARTIASNGPTPAAGKRRSQQQKI